MSQGSPTQAELAARHAAGDPLVTFSTFYEGTEPTQRLYIELTPAQAKRAEALRTSTRDVEVTLRVKVRPTGDEPAGPRVTEALLQLIENQRFRDGAHINGEIFALNGDYVQVSYTNDYRVHGVIEQIDHYRVPHV